MYLILNYFWFACQSLTVNLNGLKKKCVGLYIFWLNLCVFFYMYIDLNILLEYISTGPDFPEYIRNEEF